jgi:hypothetical protein
MSNSFRVRVSFVLAMAIAGSAAPAMAGGAEGSIGVGAEAQLSTVSGLSMNYDAGRFHVGGLLGFSDQPGANNSVLQLGGRFFWRVASSAMADFSVGGQFGYDRRNNAAGNTADSLFLEPGFQIRAFVASNVALSFTGGIVIGTADAEGFSVLGQINAGAGVHYYFF